MQCAGWEWGRGRAQMEGKIGNPSTGLGFISFYVDKGIHICCRGQ